MDHDFFPGGGGCGGALFGLALQFVRGLVGALKVGAGGGLDHVVAARFAGEVAALKDNLNQMIKNLQETTQRSTDLAKLTRLLQGQRDLMAVSKSILSEVAPLVGAQHGAFYLGEADSAEEVQAQSNGHSYKLLSGYAYKDRKGLSNRFRMGEGLVGQCALERERILVTDAPADYVQIASGLGESRPAPGARVLFRPHGASAMRATDARIVLVVQFVIRDIVVVDVAPDMLREPDTCAGQLRAGRSNPPREGRSDD